MRKINRADVVRIILVLALVGGIGLALGTVGRFVPTHKIEEPVYCGSCHPEQVEELNETTHLGAFAKDIEDAVDARNRKTLAGNPAAEIEPITAADAISMGCQMCHNYWDNFKWWGVRNFSVDTVEYDDPSITAMDPPADIYGNPVSPYGLASTQSYVANVTNVDPLINYHSGPLDVEPWTAGLDNYQFTDSGGTVHSRLDYVWSKFSSLSPGPVGYRIINTTDATKSGGCGTAEKGMCHIAVGAVTGNKKEFPEWPNGSNKTLSGTGIFFQHEMAFTTAQYAAKPVKICGACHVFKLPPMRWGGEPWSWVFVESASNNPSNLPDSWGTPGGPILDNADPFGFQPTYNDLTGQADVVAEIHGGAYNEKAFRVAFRTPDWAHANVPCIRCHAHAGINGKTVSENAGIYVNTTTGLYKIDEGTGP